MTRNLIVLCLVSVLGCNHVSVASDALDLEQVSENAAQLDGKRVSTTGFLVDSELSGLYLYSNAKSAGEEDYASGIDVVLDDKLKRHAFSSQGQCASVEGEFTAFSDSVIGMGYYRSQAGYITADVIRIEDCGREGKEQRGQ